MDKQTNFCILVIYWADICYFGMKMLLYTSGYQESVAETLLKVKVKQLQLVKRNLVVCLMFDEVHLKNDISYCNAEDRIIGKHMHIPQTYCAQWGEWEFESGSHTNPHIIQFFGTWKKFTFCSIYE